ncbi:MULTISPECIES: DUF1249 family protein [unclassified Vibrio]|uniref:DUF1249 family protein n=1 Tax=Vibrio sp. HB236076 TaxID=3232307 RepID=A0AB39HCN0_9VIBR|nr:DUF1249 family protein [Vibrio sp. HB161653]MDP5254519.1 DUF1249 family protein [Vibrio sp. HB161653]
MNSASNKAKYHVDFVGLMRVYETNYAKLNALLPNSPQVDDVRCYQAIDILYQLTVREVTKYTTVVDICQSDSNVTFPLPTMSVRLYHDARVAEVFSSGDVGRVQAKYDYPNRRLMQPDEKHQINLFLGEWLTFCLRSGISRVPITFN